ncbi:MAG: D-alanyl-D-alanine carboxypeptidase family protein [Eubacteriales bacterium]|nr:D-alanyl-D-alanine carboxypeptidase family protein [Eubacteriales bacterium]
MKRKIKRLLTFLLACQLFLITAYANPDWPSDTGVQAESGIVMDADSGAVLFGQNIHNAYPPASITKILTALLVVENCELDETVTFSETAMMSVEADSGNKLSLVTGDQMTVEDALYSLLLISVNQAANALAEHVAGDIPSFVDMMNAKIAELGCQDSHFENPSGLNGDTQNVSAYDMALIARAAYANETLLKISSDLTHTIAPTTNNPEGVSFRTEHRLLYTDDDTSPYYFPAAVAGKTGYLLKAGNTLVTYAEEDDRKLVSVILKGQPRQYFVDAKSLMEFGFRSFHNIEIATRESRYVTGDGLINLDGTDYKSSELMIEPGRFLTLPNNADFDAAELTLGAIPEGTEHPANALAQLTYTYNDRVIGTAFLMSKEMPAVPETDADGNQTGETNADGTPLTPDSSASNGNGSDGSADGTTGKDAEADSKHTTGGSSVPVLPIILVTLLIALAASAVGWILYSRKKEAEALARRREQRRKRLQESGEEEEFNRLLEERKQRT